jgi:FlaG/FlaF family flagellin (archaellin)
MSDTRTVTLQARINTAMVEQINNISEETETADEQMLLDMAVIMVQAVRIMTGDNDTAMTDVAAYIAAAEEYLDKAGIKLDA